MKKRPKKALTIIDALEDRQLLGAMPCFRDLRTWVWWVIFLKAVYGLPLRPDEEPIFCAHTGRSRYSPPEGGYREAVAIVGRQAGKDRIASLIQDFEAMSARPEADGTETYAISIAQDQRSSMRTAFRYATAPFEIVPALAQSVKQQRSGAWTLENGVVISSYPCRPEAVRGLRAVVAVCSELAFFRSSENLPVDVEMLRALRPCLATTGGRLIILSSPYGQSGALWDLHRQHFGADDSSVLVWKATAPEMNPTLPADYLKRMEQDDPEAYRSEVLGEFRSGVATFFESDNLTACVERAVHERARLEDQPYVGAIDAASGSGKDRFTLAIAHADGARAVLDCVRVWSPPFNPSGVIAEAVEVLRQFGCYRVTGDRYAPGFVLEAFSSHNMEYVFSERDRSAIYLDALPLVNAGRAVLLDLPELLRELRGLERRRGTSGRDRVDHAPNQHDDIANAVCLALTLAMRSINYIPFEFIGSLPETEAQQQASKDKSAQEIEACVQGTGFWWPGESPIGEPPRTMRSNPRWVSPAAVAMCEALNGATKDTTSEPGSDEARS